MSDSILTPQEAIASVDWCRQFKLTPDDNEWNGLSANLTCGHNVIVDRRQWEVREAQVWNRGLIGEVVPCDVCAKRIAQQPSNMATYESRVQAETLAELLDQADVIEALDAIEAWAQDKAEYFTDSTLSHRLRHLQDWADAARSRLNVLRTKIEE